MRIGAFDTDQRVLVVAELGNNHEGDLAKAHEMVRAAAECGAGAVKVQTFRTEHFVNRRDEARFARLKSFELPVAAFAAIAADARARGLCFIATPLDVHSAAALEPMVDAYKIASGDITFNPLLTAVARTGKPVVLSSGASTAEEVEHAASVIRGGWAGSGASGQLAVLHCVSSYPAPIEEANLLAIRQLGERCGATPGYSDHVLGLEASVAAVAVGARIVEKHFTLDKQLSDFRDHHLSADPAEMRELVARIQVTERMLGTGEKRIQPSETGIRTAIRRSVVMSHDCGAGHVLSVDDVTWLRPGGGMAPGMEQSAIGRRLRRDVREGDLLSLQDFE